MFRTKVFFLLFFFLLGNVLSAQEIKFKHITIDDGLSAGYVTSILQDSRGFMWFGTQDGLNKFDGYSFKKYGYIPTDSNSLSHNSVNYLFEDSRHTLWIATKGGLNAFDLYSNQLQQYKYDVNDSLSLLDDNVWCVTEDQEGTIWIGTEKGLNTYDPQTKRIKRYEFSGGKEPEDHNILSEYGVRTLYIDEEGLIWMGTFGGGVCSFHPASGSFKDYKIHEEDLDQLYKDYQLGAAQLSTRIEDAREIRDIIPVSETELWVATNNGGILVFNKSTQKFEKVYLRKSSAPEQGISFNKVLSLSHNKKGKIWIGTHGGGINLYNEGQQKFTHYQHNDAEPSSLINSSVNYVYEDKRGILWVATLQGISIYFPSHNLFQHYHRKNNTKNTLSNDKVMAICEDRDGLLWIGTMGGGVNTFDRRTNEYKQYPGFSVSSTKGILSICEDSQGIIWVGSYGGGLVRYDKEKNKYKVYDAEHSELLSGTVTCILEENDSILWIGTYGRNSGLYELNTKTETFTQYTINNGMSNNNVFSLTKDWNGDLWIGTVGGGINKRDHKTGEFTAYENIETLNSSTVNCIYATADSILWIGTTIGLYYFNPRTEQVKSYYEVDGLPNDYIYGILGDKEGELWLSTNRGISKFNPFIKNFTGHAFRNYDENYGVQGKEFNQGAYFQSTSGEMFFGGMSGFNSFYPKEVIGNQYLPPVYISSFEMHGQEVALDTVITNKKHIYLSWRDNTFTIGFVGLDYQLSNKIEYSYVLEGLTDEWSAPSTRRYANYPDLDGGDYTFKVVVANNAGVWGNEVAILHIHVAPPFWETLWFRILMIVLIVLGVIAFVRYRTQSIKKENELLELKVAERTQELAEKNRDITSSIQYAKRIQEAMLPSQQQIFQNFPEAFIIYTPKDIVSGDFYWFGAKQEKKIIAAVDCTGHGVPGAFMSMIGHNLLSQIVMEKDITDADEILNRLNKGVQNALKQGGKLSTETNDGMDVSLCVVNGLSLEYAGAYRPLIVVHEGEVKKVEGDKFPIGGAQLDKERIFTKKKVEVQKGDTVYLFSDGYADQFGGPKGKKFMLKRFYELLSSIHGQNMEAQKAALEKSLQDWKGDYDQVDDILVIGIRF